jgi:hypothetical protein
MDCLDCHTRPSHQFQLPVRALDEALALGSIPPSLPWIKKLGLELLVTEYVSAEQADAAIVEGVTEFYRREFPTVLRSRREAIERSAAGLVAIYQRNVFPSMAVTWGTYPDYSGHTDFNGCFRCHGADQRTAGGEAIRSDCAACHSLLAVRESEPDILEQLGVMRP